MDVIPEYRGWGGPLYDLQMHEGRRPSGASLQKMSEVILCCSLTFFEIVASFLFTLEVSQRVETEIGHGA